MPLRSLRPLRLKAAEDLKGGLLLRAGLGVLRYALTDELPERLREILQLIALLERQSVTEYLGTILRYLAAVGSPVRWATVKGVFKETLEEEVKEAVMQAPFVLDILQEGIEQGLEQGLAQGLERGLTQGLERGRMEGRMEGRAEGRAEGKRQEALHLVLRLLRRRFGTLAPETEAAIEALTLERLEALGDALLDFQTHDDLRAWLQASPAL